MTKDLLLDDGKNLLLRPLHVNTTNSSHPKSYFFKKRVNQAEFDEEFGFVENQKNLSTRLNCDIPHMSYYEILCSFVPIFKWLPQYDIKNNLVCDMIGGLTVGIMQIPQGLAYATLAGAQPANGLYTSLFPAFFYMLFGTSRHVSIGVFAIVSLMVGTCNTRILNDFPPNTVTFSTLNSTGMSDEEKILATEVITSLALLVGILQILMAVFRLDFLTAYLSDAVIKGFTTGAAVHVAFAQFNKLLGVKLPRASGFGKLANVSISLATTVNNEGANLITLAMSLVAIVILYSLKNFLDPIMKKHIKIPLPYDLVIVIIFTSISSFLQLPETYHIKNVGEVPRGLPMPAIPRIWYFTYIWKDAIAIAVVSLVVTISMGKLFAKKHNYPLDVRQEFYAMGFMQSLSSLFPVWPAATGLARTLIYEAAGTKTQLATLFSSALLISVLYLATSLLYHLPECILSCIILVALKGMFMQLAFIKQLWTVSKTDVAVFLVTFITTVIWDIVEGLAIGVGFGLFLILCRIQNAKLVELGFVQGTQNRKYFCPLHKYKSAERELLDVRYVRFSAPLIYLNAENFKKSIDEFIEAELPDGKLKDYDQCTCPVRKESVNITVSPIKEEVTVKELDGNHSSDCSRTLIVDLSRVLNVDYTGAAVLSEVFLDQKKRGVGILFVGANAQLIGTLESMNEYNNPLSSFSTSFFPSIEDANMLFDGSHLSVSTQQ